MKILATADLHVSDGGRTQLGCLKRRMDEEKPDAVLIAGDVFERNASGNPFMRLHELGARTAFCLGNHEFAFRSVKGAMDAWRAHRQEYENWLIASGEPKLVTLLDLEPVEMDGVWFFGNVLWYDGTCSMREDRESLVQSINPHWLDSQISGFDAKSECLACENRLKREYDGRLCAKSVLVTHTVPHRDLNLFNFTNEGSWCNAYSGVGNLFGDFGIYPDYAVCGHTHKPVRKEIEGVKCLNVGNDYFQYSGEVKTMEFEI